MKEMDYKRAFEALCKQIEREIEWTKESMEEEGKTPFLRGALFAYESIERTGQSIEREGSEYVDKMLCEEYDEDEES